jgi:D-ala D-ala ligase C-terminus
MTETNHLLGLLLGTEQDWPSAFESIVRRVGPVTDAAGTEHHYDVERIVIEPFDLRAKPRYDLVIDRLAYWYYHPREWLKKVAMMDDVYLLNSPFTFQSMEKHAAYCAMMRLGLKVPQTVLVPYKNPPEHPKYAPTAARYNRPFDLDEIAERIGYPIFMKPYDGGAWVGVSHIRNREELHRAYDDSGQRLMHLQKAVAGYDVFARSLSIGAETMVMKFDADQPMHARYSVSHGFLDPAVGEETVTIGRLVNAFFRWEFNSCETLIKDGEVYPIDYANACPDVAITSLHYYFPWAMKALVKWSIFCTATGRRGRLDLDTRRYFDIADRTDVTYAEKLVCYRDLADDYFEVERYADFCASRLSHLDEVVLEWVEGPDFDQLLVETVQATFPAHEHDQFVAHYRGLLGAWAGDERARLAVVG